LAIPVLSIVDDDSAGSLVADGGRFASRLMTDGQELRRSAIETLQINIGKMCNQTCSHCHVDAGPWRTEIMTAETIDRILAWLARSSVTTIDVTGGAPEMNPNFERLVRGVRSLNRHVIDRCNLTVIFEPGKEHLPEFFAEMEIELVCSLPCYQEENVDKQRGSGVYEKSIRALRILNELGYGKPETGLKLDLVFNPVGTALPPPQGQLEADYKRELKSRFSIEFNRLWTITNMPISRFEKYLHHKGELYPYMDRLMDAHNAENVERVMCRSTLSVGWEGELYDCDFNQMLDWRIGNGQALHLWDIEPSGLDNAPIRIGDHCFGCTAGAGSSCTGSLG
jgi:radical SAM/Cys-rich protein